MDGDSKLRSRSRPRRAPARVTDAVDPLDRYIARLYRSGLQVPAEDFRAFALRELGQIMRYDSALWGSGVFAERRFHTCTLIGLPDAYPATLEATYDINPLVPHLVNELDCPVDSRAVVADKKFYASEIYRRTFGPFGIERILATTHLDRRSGLYSLISVYRSRRADVFSAEDKARQARIVYHLAHAASHAFFLRLVGARGRPHGSAAAVVDRLGCFHQAQPQFLDLLDAHYPQRQPQQLPFALPASSTTVALGELRARTESAGDLYLVYLWRAGPLDRLTAREREIVSAVAQGMSFKQAAKKIGLAPSTVANHLYRVYRKLGVYSRTELAALVHPQ